MAGELSKVAVVGGLAEQESGQVRSTYVPPIRAALRENRGGLRRSGACRGTISCRCPAAHADRRNRRLHKPVPRGCLVVTAATNCSSTHRNLQQWLAQHRRRRTKSIVDRLRRAATEGELPAEADIASIGQAVATFLNGLSIQARDGISLRRTVPIAMRMLQQDDTTAPTDATGGAH